MTESLYELRGVARRYAGRLVLDVDALDVRAGEILGLVGPSGAGKSTLLRHLAFLESPDSGRLTYRGRPAGPDLPLDIRREVTMVFQRLALLNRSVLDNVLYGLHVRGLSGHRDRALQLLDWVGLGAFARAPARLLSGGEQQRLALARALVIEPRVLLLDEPTANLDPANIAIIEQLICDASNQGTTILLVTHNIFQARRLATRTALLLEGRLVEIAPTPQFFQSPCDPRTAAFVRGDMLY